jgi:ATPase subunit of ABC transporter with duplicated ATPase domains
MRFSKPPPSRWNGVGKTTLVGAIVAAASGDWTGGPSVMKGDIVVGRNTRVAHLDQARADGRYSGCTR